MPTLEKGLVLSNRQLYRDMYEMEFLAPNIANHCTPGQFVHVIASQSNDPLLRRPLSLYDVNKDTGSISLLYKVVGRGTDWLTQLAVNARLDVMGALGKGFTWTNTPRKVLLVGGGVGIAPLVYLARELKSSHNEVTVLYGCNSRNEAVAVERLQSIGANTILVTMDGSSKHNGLLIPALFTGELKPAEIDFLYTCGPEAMMAAWSQFARQNGIPGEVSLEEHMACGVGACLGCARKLKPEDVNYAKVCKDGPVFSLDDVEL